jgi:translation initiation factor IF-2
MPRSSPPAKSSTPATRKRPATTASAAKKPAGAKSVLAAPAKSAPASAKKAAEPEVTPAVPTAPVETLSLIDGPKPRKPRAGAAAKSKPAFTPISGIKTPTAKTALKKTEPTPTAVPAKVEVLDLISTAEEKVARIEAETPVVAEAVASPTIEATEVADAPLPEKVIHIKPPIVVRELANQLGVKAHVLIKELIELNIFAGMNQTIEPDTATKLCEKHGFVFEVERRKEGGGVHKVIEKIEAPIAPVIEVEEQLQPRAPIITFMGHVDHGKTSLMDAIRKTRVAAGEAGGITQHIGAYRVEYQGKPITFLDTPGHAAFTAMRARGANVTDIVVLVIAADDGMMPQSIEAMNHAKAAGVKIVVALNKIDLPGANIDRVKQQLQGHDLAPDDWGGHTVVCPVSATKGTGIDHLLEMLVLESELLELKANPSSAPRATVIEAQVEAGRGPTATIIDRTGTLKVGDPFICGPYWGKVKAMLDDRSKPIKEAGPSVPARIIGFSGLPNAGDELVVMESEKSARTLSEERLEDLRSKKLAPPARASLENLLSMMNAAGKKALRIVLKSDVQGSLEAIVESLKQIPSNKVDIEFIHTAAGPITESDVLLASASQAVIIGFNTKVEAVAVNAAKREGIQVKLYSIIYELIDQVKDAMAGLLDPETRETVVGHAEVRQVFELTKGNVAGCYVTDGRILRSGRARLLRKRQPVYDGGIGTLRRFQDDVKEVRNGFECGIKLGDFSDYEVGDIIEVYQLEKVAQKL